MNTTIEATIIPAKSLKPATIALLAALNSQQSETLDSELQSLETTFADASDIEPAIDCEIVTNEELQSNQTGLLSLMSQIHNDIATTINEMRAAIQNGFASQDDRYIPESNDNNFNDTFKRIASF